MNITSSAPWSGRGLVGMFGVLAIAAIASSGCDNGPASAAAITLDIPTTNLMVGQTVQITPTVKDAKGKVLIDRTVTYQSSSPMVAAVTSAGAVVALNPGGTNVTATVEGVVASIGIVVSPIPASRVVITPDTGTLAAATTRQLTAAVLDSAGHVLQDRAVSWSTSDTSIARVTQGGLVTAYGPGSVTITAAAEGKSGQAHLTVTAAAVAQIEVSPSTLTVREMSTARFTATARDLNGRILTGRQLNWTSSDVTVATVDQTGQVSGLKPGLANILVTSGGVFGGSVVIVQAVPVGSVTIAPDTATLELDGTVQLAATVKDTAGRVITFKPVTWSSQNLDIATVSSTGLVTAKAYGSVGIVAAREGKADTAFITVNPPGVGSVSLLPNPANLGVGRTSRFGLETLDVNGNPANWRVTWSTDDESVALVDTLGNVKGVAPGSTTIYAAAGGRLAAATVTVVSSTMASLTLSPTTATMVPGASQLIQATARAADMSVLPSRMITFSSSDPDVASVDRYGLVRAVAGGTCTITVTGEGLTATAAITVQ